MGLLSHHQVQRDAEEDVTEEEGEGWIDLRWRGGEEELRSGLGKSQADIRLSSDRNEEN